MRKFLIYFLLSVAAMAQTTYRGGVTPPPSGGMFKVQRIPNTVLPVATGSVTTVTTAGQLTSALTAPVCGNVIEIPHGTTITGQFIAGVPTGTCDENHYVIIRSDNWALLPPRGVRINTSTDIANMATIKSNSTPYAIFFGDNAKYYWILGIEVTTQAFGGIDLIRIGGSSTTQSACPNHIVVDRSYIHGFDPIHVGNDVRNGVTINGSFISVIDSVVRYIHQEGNETHGIAAWQCNGAWLVRNNEIEADAINLFFGGTDPIADDMYPMDVTADHNWIYKDWQNWWLAYLSGTNGGSVNAYTLTAGSAVAYNVGDTYNLAPSATNTTTAPTMNVNGIGAATITDYNGVSITNISLTSNVVTVTASNGSPSALFTAGSTQVLFTGLTTNTFLNGQILTVQSVATSTFTVNFTHANVGSVADTGVADKILPIGRLVAGSANLVRYDGFNFRISSQGFKNLYEVKFCVRCEAYANIFEYSMVGSQVGFCVLGSARSDNGAGIFRKAAQVADFYLHDNLIQHCSFGFRFTGWDSNQLFSINTISLTANTLTVTVFGNPTTLFPPGSQVLFTDVAPSSFLSGQILTVQSVNSTSFTANFVHADVTSGSNSGSAIAYPLPVMQTRVRLENNLWRDIGPPFISGGGTAFVSTGSPDSISVEHNTMVPDATNGIILNPDAVTTPPLQKTNNFIFKNNLSSYGQYGFKGTGDTSGTTSLKRLHDAKLDMAQKWYLGQHGSLLRLSEQWHTDPMHNRPNDCWFC
jgi:hypothetical protein